MDENSPSLKLQNVGIDSENGHALTYTMQQIYKSIAQVCRLH